MFSTELSEKFLSIQHEINKHINVITETYDNISSYEKVDASIILYIQKINKCCCQLKKLLEILDIKSELYSKNIEINDKNHILANIRHDLLNPMNGIKGYSEFILEKNSDPYVAIKLNEIIVKIDLIIELISHINSETFN